MNKKVLIILMVLLLAFISITSVLLLKKSQVQTTSNALPAQDKINVVIEENSWKFSPETITLVAGKKNIIVINNKDSYPHGFAVKELDINVFLPPNSTTPIEVTPTKNGEFTSYCSVSCGKGHVQMKGKVIITN